MGHRVRDHAPSRWCALVSISLSNFTICDSGTSVPATISFVGEKALPVGVAQSGATGSRPPSTQLASTSTLPASVVPHKGRCSVDESYKTYLTYLTTFSRAATEPSGKGTSESGREDPSPSEGEHHLQTRGFLSVLADKDPTQDASRANGIYQHRSFTLWETLPIIYADMELQIRIPPNW